MQLNMRIANPMQLPPASRHAHTQKKTPTKIITNIKKTWHSMVAPNEEAAMQKTMPKTRATQEEG